jgi:hypothetical protein
MQQWWNTQKKLSHFPFLLDALRTAPAQPSSAGSGPPAGVEGSALDNRGGPQNHGHCSHAYQAAWHRGQQDNSHGGAGPHTLHGTDDRGQRQVGHEVSVVHERQAVGRVQNSGNACIVTGTRPWGNGQHKCSGSMGRKAEQAQRSDVPPQQQRLPQGLGNTAAVSTVIDTQPILNEAALSHDEQCRQSHGGLAEACSVQRFALHGVQVAGAQVPVPGAERAVSPMTDDFESLPPWESTTAASAKQGRQQVEQAGTRMAAACSGPRPCYTATISAGASLLQMCSSAKHARCSLSTSRKLAQTLRLCVGRAPNVLCTWHRYASTSACMHQRASDDSWTVNARAPCLRFIRCPVYRVLIDCRSLGCRVPRVACCAARYQSTICRLSSPAVVKIQ